MNVWKIATPVKHDNVHHVHVHHEWERLRGFQIGGEEKDGTEEWQRVRGLGGKE